MPLAVWPSTPAPRHPSTGHSDVRPVVVAAFAGGGVEQRAVILSRKLRRYALSYRVRNANRLILDAFLEARGMNAESFLFKDLDDFTRTGVAIGTGDNATTAFVLPTTGQYGGDYPLTTDLQLYVDAAPVDGTADTDSRTLTYDAAPAGTTALTADYHYYRRVRLESAPDWRKIAHDVFEGEIVLVEVPQT